MKSQARLAKLESAPPNMRKQFIEVPLQLDARPLDRLRTLLSAVLLSPLSLAVASIRGAPGIGLHLRIMRTGLRLMLLGRLPWNICAGFMLFRMESTRYFEFDAVGMRVGSLPFKRYLDISSPRFAPVFHLQDGPDATAVFINPDASDLDQTRALASALGLDARCSFFNGVLEDLPEPAGSFDLVTCISVLEHIPDDTKAIESMWAALRPGGRLLLTLPCMAVGLEQFISHDQYGVLQPGEDGYTFWQRYYDQDLLSARIFRKVGVPAYTAIYGEKRCGLFFRNATMKRLLGARYPSWREPLMVANEYQRYSSIGELPGEGVVMREFSKPTQYRRERK